MKIKISKNLIFNFLTVLCLISFLIADVNLYYAYKYPVKYANIISNEASATQFDADFICAVIAVESGFKKYALSSKGAMGLMQILPSTAIIFTEQLDIELNDINDLYDETINIRIGTTYLRYLKNKFFNIATVLAAYNAGETNVMSWLLDVNYSSDGATLITTPFKETNDYIDKVMTALRIYRTKRRRYLKKMGIYNSSI